MDEKELRKEYDEKLNEFGFKYALTINQEKEIIMHYEAEDYENPNKRVVLVFGINRETGKTGVSAIFSNGNDDTLRSYGISFDELFDVLNASYEKGKGLSVKKFIDNLVD